MKIKDHVYYARIIPGWSYDICELIIRTVADDYFVGIDKRDKHAYLLSYSDINKTVFINRSEALEYVKQRESKDKEDLDNDVAT